MEGLDQDIHRTNQRLPRQQRGPRGGPEAAEGERFECSARSCAAALIADCVALCCCPCAVLSFVALALVKVPWAVGRRCLAAGKMARKKRRKKRKTTREEGYDNDGGVVSAEESDGKKGWWTEEGIMGISSSPSLSFEESEQERVWWELFQVGHLGFGRVSFTGNGIQLQPQLKPN